MAADPMFDVLIRGGTLIDGTGAQGHAADVAVTGARIVAVGDLADCPARLVIDANGLVVAPGFIDVHTHDDLACIRDPEMLAKLSQGVTTVVVGNCGLSALPLRFESGVPEPFNLLGDATEFRYAGVAEFAAEIGRVHPSVNVAVLIGHSSLRLECMSELDRAATPEELQRMEELLARFMREGALGFSSGLFYAPASAADTEELKPLARIAAAAGGVYTAHVRNEYEGVIEALKEFFSVSHDERLPLVVSHHKCAGVRNWGRSRETLALIDEARRSQPIYMDCYPYAAGSTVLREDLADGEIEVLVNWSEPYPEMAGRKLRVIADEWRCTEAEAAARLAPGGASYFQMHEDDVRAILSHEACMVGSDGLPNDPLPHPRLWGTFPRMLGHYARDEGLVPLATAVHRMTGLSAQTFRLQDRGVIRTGAIADITVFDPESVGDVATYERPQQLSRGIEHVLVGGVLSWSAGRSTDQRGGRFVPRGTVAASAGGAPD